MNSAEESMNDFPEGNPPGASEAVELLPQDIIAGLYQNIAAEETVPPHTYSPEELQDIINTLIGSLGPVAMLYVREKIHAHISVQLGGLPHRQSDLINNALSKDERVDVVVGAHTLIRVFPNGRESKDAVMLNQLEGIGNVVVTTVAANANKHTMETATAFINMCVKYLRTNEGANELMKGSFRFQVTDIVKVQAKAYYAAERKRPNNPRATSRVVRRAGVLAVKNKPEDSRTVTPSTALGGALVEAIPETIPNEAKKANEATPALTEAPTLTESISAAISRMADHPLARPLTEAVLIRRIFAGVSPTAEEYAAFHSAADVHPFLAKAPVEGLYISGASPEDQRRAVRLCGFIERALDEGIRESGNSPIPMVRIIRMVHSMHSEADLPYNTTIDTGFVRSYLIYHPETSVLVSAMCRRIRKVAVPEASASTQTETSEAPIEVPLVDRLTEFCANITSKGARIVLRRELPEELIAAGYGEILDDQDAMAKLPTALQQAGFRRVAETDAYIALPASGEYDTYIEHAQRIQQAAKMISEKIIKDGWTSVSVEKTLDKLRDVGIDYSGEFEALLFACFESEGIKRRTDDPQYFTVEKAPPAVAKGRVLALPGEPTKRRPSRL